MSTKTAKGRQTASTGKAKSGKKGRKPITPVRVGKDRNWGPIILFVVVGLIAAGIIGAAAWGVLNDKTWQERAEAIEGLVNYRNTNPAMLTAEHVSGVLEYEVMPPVGGDHNDYWQNCNGMVYDAPIAKEHAVHSLEHGAVWVTYSPDLPADQVQSLARRVEGTDYMLMSPFEELDSPISLQAWGYQLKVDDAADPRIDEFIQALRLNASVEPGATCGSQNSITTTGTTPTVPPHATSPRPMER
jgi:hypothetical protein